MSRRNAEGLHDIPNKCGNKSKIGGLGAGALTIITLIFTIVAGWKGGLYGPSC